MALAGARRERDRQRDPGEARERRARADQRCQRRVGLVHGVAQTLEELQAEAVAAGPGHREASRCDDDGIGLERRRALARDDPAAAVRRESVDQRVRQQRHAAAASERQQAVAHVAGAVGRGEELAGLRLLHQDEAELALEEGDLLAQRPGAQHLSERVRGGIGHEPRLVDARRQDVAAPAAADQDLAPAVGRALEQQRLGVGRGREDRRHRAGRARADHRHTPPAGRHERKIIRGGIPSEGEGSRTRQAPAGRRRSLTASE